MFRAANDHRMAIVVHVRASVTANLPYGHDEAVIFLKELLPAAPDVVVQVAHLAGAGSAADEGAQQALDVFADAVAKRDARTRLLYFDVTALGPPLTPEQGRRWAAAIRQDRAGARAVRLGCDPAECHTRGRVGRASRAASPHPRTSSAPSRTTSRPICDSDCARCRAGPGRPPVSEGPLPIEPPRFQARRRLGRGEGRRIQRPPKAIAARGGSGSCHRCGPSSGRHRRAPDNGRWCSVYEMLDHEECC